MALFTIAANDIDISGHPVEGELPIAWLEQELADANLTGIAPGHLSARLSRTGEDIVVRGHVTAHLKTPCARCLEPTELSVAADLSLLLKNTPSPHVPVHHKGASPAAPRGKAAEVEAEYEFSAEEADTDTYDGETVVLDGFVREAILLEIPNFPLCRDDCPGIGPAPGTVSSLPAEPEIDPRLLPLQALRERLSVEPSPSATKNGRATQKRTVSKKNKE